MKNLRLAPLAVVAFTAFFLFGRSAFAQNGNVGIGTTNPQSKLHTVGSVRHDTLGGIGNRLVFADVDGRLFALGVRGHINTQPVVIPDSSCGEIGASSTITVTGMPTAVSSANIRVRMDISHTWIADLDIYIISPSGDTLQLISDNGGGGINFTNTIFWDGAPSALATNSSGAPFTGTYKPTGGTAPECDFSANVSTFGAMGGGSIVPNGVWTLLMLDDANGDEGTLNNWVITFDSSGLESLPASGFTTNAVSKGSNGGLVSGSIYDVSGNIGIGVPSPHALLQFHNSLTNRKIVLFETTNNDHQFYGFGVNGGILRYQTDHAGADHVFYSATSITASNELMRIRGNGNVGIGTATPTARLSVNGAANNTTGAWGVFSDARIKTVSGDFTDGLNVINRLRPVRFRYNVTAPFASDDEQVGIIAQELEAAAPYMVSTAPGAGLPDLRQVNGQAYVFLLINAVKEQQAEIARLKEEAGSARKELESLRADAAALGRDVAQIKAALDTDRTARK